MTDDTFENAEQHAEQPPQRSFLARNWALPTVAVGLAALAAALIYWRVFATPSFQQKFRERLQHAAELVETSPYQARPVLADLLPHVWRSPQDAGKIHLLLGRANEKLADNPDIDPERARHYHHSALLALREADSLGVSNADRLSLSQSLGRMLVFVGKQNERPLAISMLSDAKRRREQIAWTIEFLTLLAELQADSVVLPECRQIALRLERLAEPDSDRADIATKIIGHIDRGDSAELLRYVQSVEIPFDAEDEPLAAALFQNLQPRVQQGERDTVLVELDQARSKNDSGLSRVLKSLSVAAAEFDPPVMSDAVAHATRRMELPGIDQRERDNARLALAEVLLADDEPIRARKILAELAETSQTNQQATFLLARSYLEEAERLRKTPDTDWLKSNASLHAYSQWLIQEWGPARSRDPDEPPQNDAISAVLLAAVQPIVIKTAVTRAAYRRARDSFQQLLSKSDLPDELAAPSMLWLAVAYAETGQLAEARSLLQEVMRRHAASPIEQAAQFQLADLYRREAQPILSLDEFRKAANTVPEPGRYHNQILPPQDLRDIFIENWHHYQNRQRDYASAAAIAELYRNFQKMASVEPGQPDEFYAKSNLELARQAMRAAQQRSPDASLSLEQEAWAHFREAGQAFARVAKVREASDDYPALLWLAATNLFDGRQFHEAIPHFIEFVDAHVDGPREFPARMYLARSYMALLEYEKAKKTLEEALQEERKAVDRFQGRILLAQCDLEIARQIAANDPDDPRHNLYTDKAEKLLLQNISGTNQELEPSAPEWRDSLFLLGQLLFESGRFDDAIARFEEYVRRYPDQPQSIDARNYLGEAFLAGAEALQREIDLAATQRDKARLQQQRATRLQLARDHFQKLVQRLTRSTDNRQMTDHYESLLASALFKTGRIDSMLGQRLQAIEAFEDFAYRYQDRPDCIAAYVEMSAAYADLGRPVDAESALRQALWILDRMDEKAFANADQNRDQIRKQIESLLPMP